MKTAFQIIGLTAGLFTAVAAQATESATGQVLAASVAALPAISAPDQLHASTEAAIQRQITEIDSRLTTVLAGGAAKAQSTHADTQLAVR